MIRPPPRSPLFPSTPFSRSTLARLTPADLFEVFPPLDETERVRHAELVEPALQPFAQMWLDRKSTRLNSSHGYISYAVFCLKKKKNSHHSYILASCYDRMCY